jgi:hypothetical protein
LALVAALLVGVFLVTRPAATLALGLLVLALAADVFFLVAVRFLPSGSVEIADSMRGLALPAVYHVSHSSIDWCRIYILIDRVLRVLAVAVAAIVLLLRLRT